MFLKKNITRLTLMLLLLGTATNIHAAELPSGYWQTNSSPLFLKLHRFFTKPVFSLGHGSVLHSMFAPRRDPFLGHPPEVSQRHGLFGHHAADATHASLAVLGANLKHLMKSLAQATKLAVEDPDGEFKAAFKELIAWSKEECKPGGAINEALKSSLSMWEEQFQRGKPARLLVEEFLRGIKDNINDPQGEIRAAIEGASGIIRAQGIIGIREWAQQGGQEVQNFGNILENRLGAVGQQIDRIGGTAEERLRNIRGIADQIEQNAWNTGLKIALLTIFTVAAIYGIKVLWNQIERQLNIPALAIESSQKSLWQKMTGVFITHEDIPEVVFAPDLKKRLDTIVAATKNIRAKIAKGQKNVKYRNLLLWGPPGTGKSLFAKIVARSVGMDFVMITGASFAKFTVGQAIAEIDKLFEWAKNSKKGVLIFTDEAESFLGGRIGKDVTKDNYQILTNWLNHTGTRSDKVMHIIATNHPEFLDSAMSSRIDDSVEIKLPETPERAKIIRLYRDSILLDKTQNSIDFVESVKINFNDAFVEDIAKKTTGFSGRELSGIINTIITDAAVTENGLVSEELIDNVVDLAIQKNHQFAQYLNTIDRYAAPAA